MHNGNSIVNVQLKVIVEIRLCNIIDIILVDDKN